MTTDTLIGALQEAEKIVSAEWLRVQCELIATCSETPATRAGAARVALLTAIADTPGAPPPCDGARQPTRRRPGRVWPTQRSPPVNRSDRDRSRSFRKEVMP